MNEPDQGPVKAEIERKLSDALSPMLLRVVDESALHAGHHGHRPGKETHFRVEVVSAAFTGLSRLARHRRVNELLARELAEGVHALSIDAKTPAEAQ
jgi:BolA protein